MSRPVFDAKQQECLADRDWASDWVERIKATGLEKRLEQAGISQESFWKAYHGWQKTLRRNGYPGKVLDSVLEKIQSGDNLLDIGAGCGTYSIPAATRVVAVTAIEPSPNQVRQLKTAIARRHISNITILPCCWENTDLAAIGKHNLVLAAYSFQMQDIRQALQKMIAVASRLLVLVHTAGNDLTVTLESLFGIQPAPDYRYLYYILCDMGYRPEVEIISRVYPIDLETQLDMFRYNPALDPAQIGALATYLAESGRLTYRRGKTWLNREHLDAVISLKIL